MSIRRSALAALLAFPLSAAPITMTTVSSQPRFVSGGDALVEIKGVEIKGAAKVLVTLNGRDVSSVFHADAARGSLLGLVGGLNLGSNSLVARAGAQSAKLELIDHPITGPIFARSSRVTCTVLEALYPSSVGSPPPLG